MIIRLTGADFSANNIGQVQFKKELTAETLNILSKYTRPLTDAQKFAFQDFLVGLKSNNIWNNISVMYLPILSGNVTESFLNVKTLAQCEAPSTSKYSVANGWLKSNITLGASQNNTTDTAKITLNGSMMNLHFLSYINGTTINQTSTLLDTRANTSDTNIVFIDTSNTANSTFRIGSQNRYASVPTNGIGLVGFSSRTDGFTVVTPTKIENSTTGNITVDTTITNTVAYINRRNTGWASTIHEWKITSTGSSLTLAQVNTYKTLIDALVLALQ